MVYIKNTTESQRILLPKNVDGEGQMDLRIWNTIDREGFTLEVSDIPMSRLYYNLAITLPQGLSDGEYEYSLELDGDVLSSGLMIIGESEGADEYNRKITYQQYERE